MAEPSNGFDLGAAKPVVQREDEGQVVVLTDERGEPMTYRPGPESVTQPVTMTVVGTYSKRYRDARNAQIRTIRGRRGQPDPAEAEKDAVALHAQCVVQWSGFFEGGQPLECTKANVSRVLEAAPWIHEQVVAAMDDHAGFFASASSG